MTWLTIVQSESVYRSVARLISSRSVTAGEGSKPIFDREEIKRAIGETEEVEEHRTVVTVNLENSENKFKTLKRHSASLSPTRTRNHSPRRTWSRHPRYDNFKHEDIGRYRNDREKDQSRERKDGKRSYRDHRGRPREYSRDRRQTNRSRETDRPREQRAPRENYIEPVSVPIYYGNFQPRPLMVQPWGPIRGPLGGIIHPPMMRPMRTFPSRSIGIPPDMELRMRMAQGPYKTMEMCTYSREDRNRQRATNKRHSHANNIKGTSGHNGTKVEGCKENDGIHIQMSHEGQHG